MNKLPARSPEKPAKDGATAMSASDPSPSISSTRTEAKTWIIQCKQCGKDSQAKSHKKEFCSDKCRKKYAREYNAGSITFHVEEFDPLFDWKLYEDLSYKYNQPKEWIERSIKACREAVVSPQYFIDRYLEHKDIPMNKDVDRSRREQ